MVTPPPISAATGRARFATFVKRALEDARARGMTDREIARQSGVATSTFHRWRLAEGRGLPELDRVRAFCLAVGASVDDAMRALGVSDSRPEATPEPPLPRDVIIILRRLADPNVPEVQKQLIRMTLQMLADQADVSRAERAARREAS